MVVVVAQPALFVSLRMKSGPVPFFALHLEGRLLFSF